MLTIVPLTRTGCVLPSVWPLDCFSAPVHTWQRLPPHVNLRAERDAPYASVQTLCWEPRRMAQIVALATTSRVPRSVLRTFDVPPDAPTVSSRSPVRWRVIAGGVFLIGGAAMCAWLEPGNLPLRPDTSPVESASVPLRTTPHALVFRIESVPVMKKTRAVIVERKRVGKGALSVSPARLHHHPQAPKRARRLTAWFSSRPASPPTLAVASGSLALDTVPARHVMNPSNKDAVDWMSHMTQRRLTEVAEKFSQ